MRILHFSDFHLRPNGLGKRSMDIFHRMMEKLQEINQEENIDLVIFSGDMIDKGGKNFTVPLYRCFLDFEKNIIGPLVKSLNIGYHQFLFVPGNHEVDRGRKDKTFAPESNSDDAIEDFLCTNTTVPQLQDFLQFQQEYYNRHKVEGMMVDIQGLHMTLILPLNNGLKVGVSLINSAWMCEGDADKGVIKIGTSQINQSWPLIKNCKVKIAIAHHHYNFLEENESRNISDILHANYDIFAVGHTHGMKAKYEHDDKGCIFISVAAGNLYDNLHKEDPKYKNGFTILDFNEDARYMDITPYHQDVDEKFVLDKNYGIDGTNRLEDSTKKLFMPLDKWLCSYKKNYAILDNEQMKQKREQLKDSNNRIVLLAALSGLGKTRMIYETYNDGQIHPNHYYTELSDESRNKVIDGFLSLVSDIGNNDAVIIIDNCSLNLYEDIRRKIPTNIKVIFATNEYYEVTSTTNVTIIKLDSFILKKEVATYIDHNIVGQEKSTLREEVKKIADGFPAMAYELVDTYRNGKHVRLEQAEELVTKLLKFPEDKENSQRSILKALSLFQPFPLLRFNRSAYEFIIRNKIIMPLESTSFPLRKRKVNETKAQFTPTLIEDTGSLLNVRPFPLAVYLAKEWFVGLDEDDVELLLEDFNTLKNESPSAHRLLVDSMAKRIEYMRDLPLANDFIARLTDSMYGPFANEKVACSEMGSRLFLAMSSVNPKAVSDCLYTLFNNKNTEWLKENIKGDVRRNYVWALEKLCFDKDSFQKSSMVLAQLMLAENENYGNNASGQFLQLFHVMLPGTEASLTQRIDLLKTLYGREGEYVSIVLQALNSAFASHSFSRTGDAAHFGLEEKQDYGPTRQEVLNYWYACRDLVEQVLAENEESQEPIYKIVLEHSWSWISDGYFDTLFVPLVESLRTKREDFTELYNRLLRDRRNHLFRRYTAEKQSEIRVYFQKIRPCYFSSLLKETQNALYNEDKGTAAISHFDKAKEMLLPVAKKFVADRVFVDIEELKRLSDVNLFIEHAFFLNVAEIITDEDLKALWDTCVTYLGNYSDDGNMPSFISSMCYAARKRKETIQFRNSLFAKGYVKWYIGLSAKCEDAQLSIIKELVSQADKGNIDKDYLIDVYLNNVAINTHTELFRILHFIYKSFSAVSVRLLDALIRFTFMCDEEDLKEHVGFIKRLILDYPINDDNPHLNYEFTRYVISVFEKIHDVDLAKRMNVKLIEGFNHDYLHSNFEGLYSILLEKYTDEIWDDFESAFVSDEYLAFFLQVKNELGSGIGFGAGALFKVGNERIKQMCIKYPNKAPVRIAEMLPVYDRDIWECDSFSDIMIWILDNYGTQKMVLDGIHANIHSFGWTGSVIGLFMHHKMCMEKLLNHKCLEVRNWASMCIKEFDSEIQRETQQEDYMRLHYN